MSNQNPLSPSEYSSNLPEVGQSPWPQGQYGMQSETDIPFLSGASEQAPSSFGTTQYGDPGYGTSQYGDPGYGTSQYGDPGYGTTQYGAFPGSYGTDPAAVSYQQVSPTPVGNPRQRRQSLKFIILMLAIILLGCAVYVLRDLFEYGTPLLMLRLAESAAGLLLALSCFPFGSILRRQAEPAYPSSSTPQQPRDMSGPLYYGMVGLLIAGVSLYYGVPAAMDLADGPTPRTVTSCMYFQYDSPRSMFSSSSVYKDNFSINFEGGLTHTTTFISENIDDIRTRGDLATELYNACEHRERSQTMTVSYYPRTWILTDVQVSGS